MENLPLFDLPAAAPVEKPKPRRARKAAPASGLRLLHTSDWHLGQHFLGRTREAEHRAFLGWLVDQVAEQAVDVVLVAGDIFDTATPPSYARELYNGFIVALRGTGASLVVLGGNHDSAAVLAESRELLACLDTRVIPCVSATPADQLLELRRRDGEIGALLCGIPFVRPRDVVQSQAGQSAEEKRQVLQQAIQGHYADLYALAEARRVELGMALPIIATGHLTTVGASTSESVREIYVGSLDAFPTSAFPPADYIALGHIHRPQRVGGLEQVRYSGSPLCLSFDEERAKEVLLVEFGATLQRVTPVAVPCFQPLAVVQGTLDTLGAALVEAAADGRPECPVWAEVVVAGDDYLADLQPRISALVAELPLEVLRVRRARSAIAPTLQGTQRETLEELSPLDVFSQRLAEETLDDDLRTRLEGLYREVLGELPA